MTKRKPLPPTAADAAREALRAEERKRASAGNPLKPIEVLKTIIAAYQAYVFATEGASADNGAVVSDDRQGLARGTQSAVDRMLFNANYWLAAYEDRIVSTFPDACDARACLKSIAVWNSHTLRLNTLDPEDVTATFGRFCPPFAANNRRGADGKNGGKGPVPEFRTCALEIAGYKPAEQAADIVRLVADVEAEARIYQTLEGGNPLDALFDILPAWCLQDRIPMVAGGWYDNADIMLLVVSELDARFKRMGYAESARGYFVDSFREALDGYEREISADDMESRWQDMPVGDLLQIIRAQRAMNPDYEADGYGTVLPPWLIYKEQLVWNTLVCAVYGPHVARPLAVESVDLLTMDGGTVHEDIITDLARSSYDVYLSGQTELGGSPEFKTYDDQPVDLRMSGIRRIQSIPDMLKILGYRISPIGTCYPDQRVDRLSPSEVECLAVLEHRRWLAERIAAGWTLSPTKDTAAKQSPYLVPWEALPERARDCNRRQLRNLPTLLASRGLCITR
ncbi:RyR domain-containing protein [Slackia heliotrinireducens]|uniref:RyR domain-containing protein n=1 Tax=Slackia heliotrinireducens TaxID=84110 RepID=UPI00331621BF